MNVICRAMTADDYDDVRKLWMSITGFGIRKIDDSREEIERFLQRNPTTSVVAQLSHKTENPGKIVGAILCGSDGRQGYLYHVCVLSEYRRQGIGRQMVSYCMHALADLKINRVALIAFAKNDVGNAFWKQIGWNGRSDCNYYGFVLNEENIVSFIEEGTVS